MAPRRPLSLQARSTVAAGLALAAFLGVTGFALDKAYYDATVAAMRDRLQNYVYAYLAGSDVLRVPSCCRRKPCPIPNSTGQVRASTPSSSAAVIRCAGNRPPRSGANSRSTHGCWPAKRASKGRWTILSAASSCSHKA